LRYLITGGAGFIGSHLVSKIIDNAEKIIVLDNLLTGSKKNINKFLDLSNFQFISHDIQNHYDPEENIDCVIHLASCASPVAYAENPINTLKSGSIGTINSLGIARKYNSSFLLASTSEIYGDPKISPQHEEYWGNVNPVGPRSMYDESKRFAEAATQAYITEYKLNAKIVRIFNTYGPNMKLDDGRVVTNFIVQALKNKDITVFGKGLQTRSFSYVDDTVNGIMLASSYKEPDIFNIGNDNEITINQLAQTIIDITNTKSKIIYKDLPKDDPLQRKPDLSKSKELLNYEPVIGLEKGLEKTIEWVKKNID
jgi:dTDP-glucose 4,6-dehydratase|tara:strand:+ start:2436 stop:3368 length:933 start_codon:yes stop_codon:yes gene_type:complete